MNTDTIRNPDSYRVHYYPNTEKLADREIRITALGTGHPFARKSQASTGWLIEVPSSVGNDKPERIFFDIGTGCITNFSVLQIPFEDARKVFLSHLHSDHWGDFWSYWIGGRVQGRSSPIELWGPSGSSLEHGANYAIHHAVKAMKWDVDSRNSARDEDVEDVQVTQFDYDKDNLIFDKNDIKIRSWKAYHVLPGAVSFSLEWKGIKIVYSGDTRIPDDPELNNAYERHCTDADLLIHECFVSGNWHYDTEGARTDGEDTEQGKAGNHCTPVQFGERMQRIQPKHAVAFHSYFDFDTSLSIYNQIRQNYTGPLTLAKDLLTWNVTPGRTIVRNIGYHPDGYINSKYEETE